MDTYHRHGYPTSFIRHNGRIVARFSWRDGKVCVRGLPHDPDPQLLAAVGEAVGEWHRAKGGEPCVV